MIMMKTAVVYYSMSGNTQYAAEKIAKGLGADLVRIEPKKAYPDQGMKKFFWAGKSAMMGEKPELMPYEFHAEDYDRIIIGSPVWARNFAPPIHTFIAQNPELRGKKIAAFISFSGGGADKASEKLKVSIGIEQLEAELVLLDPKDKPDAANDEKLEEFCSKLQ